MFIIKYIPFLGIAFMVTLGCLLAFERRPSFKRGIIYGSLAIYLVCVAWLLFTPGQYFFDPYLQSYYITWHHAKIIPRIEALRSMGAYMNVVMTIPAGIYWGLIFGRKLNWPIMVIVAGLTGVFNEGMQLVLDVLINIQRTVDVTDMVTNAAGVLIGYLIYRFLIAPLIKSSKN